MSFQWPALLLLELLVPVLAVTYLGGQRRRARRAAALAEAGLVATGSRSRWRRHAPFVVTLVALATMLVAVARPTTTAAGSHPSGTVVLAVDVSNSMLATDVEPSRLEAAAGAARAFVLDQPPSVAIGVVAFGQGALVLQPATTERTDVLGALDRLAPGGGTSAGQAIFAALGVIAGAPLTLTEEDLAGDLDAVDIGYFPSATIVVLSDGEDTGGPDPLELAQLASNAGVKVSTIGVGTEAGAVLDVDGFQVATALDEAVLQGIADVTGGTYQRAEDAASVDRATGAVDLPVTAEHEGDELTGSFATAGLGLLVLGAALSMVWLGRVV